MRPKKGCCLRQRNPAGNHSKKQLILQLSDTGNIALLFCTTVSAADASRMTFQKNIFWHSWHIFSLKVSTLGTHCKEPIPKIGNKNFQKRNSAVAVPFMCQWAIYMFPRSICLFCCWNFVDRSWENIKRSQTHECGNWDWGRAIPRK